MHTTRTLAAFLILIGGPLLAGNSPLSFRVDFNSKVVPWPRNGPAVVLKAGELVEAGKLDEALSLLTGNDVDGDNSDIGAARSLTLSALGRSKEGLAAIDHVLQRDPEYAWGKVYRAMALLNSEQFDEARAYIEACLPDALPDQTIAFWTAKFLVNLKQNKPTAAYADCSRLVELNPCALHYLLRAQLCLQLGLYESAAQDSKAAIEKGHHPIEARLMLAWAYSELDMTQMTCTTLTEACEEYKQDMMLAHAYAQYVHQEESVTDCMTAEEMHRVADHYLELASESSSEVLADAPYLAHAHFLKGKIYLRTGDLDVAKKHLLIAQGMWDDAEPQVKIRLALEDIRQKQAANQ